ncbi:MAG: L-threonylcarbamoyladenylate synthase [Candidatus Omnitrophota bacterium]
MERITINEKQPDKESIKKAAGMISKGKVVAMPTETVYGLAVRADKEEAVEKLYSLKERPLDKPFSVALADIDKATQQYFLPLIPFGYRLIEKFWPGPLTIVYYKRPEGKIGIRIPSNFIANSVLRILGSAVFFPSANRSGQSEATSADQVEEIFGNQIDLIIDGGRAYHKESSTVIDLTYKPFKILREGVVSEKQIASTFIKRRILFVCTGNSCRSPMAEYFLRKYLQEKKRVALQRYEVISAGIAAPEGMHPPEYAQKVTEDQDGIDISGSRAKQLTKQMVLSSDYIFTMEDFQTDFILKNYPIVQNRVFNLKKFLSFGEAIDIPDPIGRSFIFYENVYDVIKKAILELVDWL